jgi:formylglycine-generating enzyme required for sulfatase activity
MYDVPAGEFLMGSDPSRDKDASPEEQPQHYVTLAAFQIARFPVTASEYACFMRSIRNEVPTHPRHLTEGEEAIGWGDHPVVFVTWHEANSYAAWLTKTTGQQWRLPTEAEWEKAARGSDGRIYPWGNAFDISRCQTRENGNNGTCPVGTYPEGASPCGAQDMAGEVWEYTSTCYKKYPYLAGDGRESTDLTDERSIRGGCFFSPNGGARAACRGHTTLDFQGAGIGFRLVRTMSDL